MEISTGYLQPSDLERELEFIIQFMAAHATSASYMYGWACEVSIDEQWIKHPVEIGDIKGKVEESIDKRIFNYGESDFYLYDAEDQFYFTLCHEGDVHFSSDNEDLVTEVNEHWRRRGYNMHEIRRNV